MTLEGLPSVSDLSIACATRFQVCTDLTMVRGDTRTRRDWRTHQRTAGGPIPGYFQTANEGAPGPSLSGPGMPQTSTRNPFANSRSIPLSRFRPFSAISGLRAVDRLPVSNYLGTTRNRPVSSGKIDIHSASSGRTSEKVLLPGLNVKCSDDEQRDQGELNRQRDRRRRPPLDHRAKHPILDPGT